MHEDPVFRSSVDDDNVVFNATQVRQFTINSQYIAVSTGAGMSVSTTVADGTVRYILVKPDKHTCETRYRAGLSMAACTRNMKCGSHSLQGPLWLHGGILTAGILTRAVPLEQPCVAGSTKQHWLH